MPTIFLSIVFHPREHTNPNILMGSKQWVRALLLSLLSVPYVFDSLRSNQKNYLHHHNHQKIYSYHHHTTHNICHHPIDLSIPV